MIDIIFAVLVVIAIIKGWRKGFAVAIFSIVAYIIGIAAALKLSAAVAVHLQRNISVSAKWLPFISFALVFIAVVILVNWLVNWLKKLFKWLFLAGPTGRAGCCCTSFYTPLFSVYFYFMQKR